MLKQQPESVLYIIKKNRHITTTEDFTNFSKLNAAIQYEKTECDTECVCIHTRIHVLARSSTAF